MAKKISGTIKLQIPPSGANPAPPVGPALGQRGVNIMDFCKKFNAATQDEQKKFPGMKLPVIITVYADKSFSFITKLPPVAQLLKRSANITSGSNNPGKEFVSNISLEQIKEIAELKIKDMNAFSIDSAIQMIIGTALSMGIEVKNA